MRQRETENRQVVRKWCVPDTTKLRSTHRPGALRRTSSRGPAYLEALSGVTGGHRHGPWRRPGATASRHVEDLGRQRPQQRHLAGRGRAHGLRAGIDPACVVRGVGCRERLVTPPASRPARPGLGAGGGTGRSRLRPRPSHARCPCQECSKRGVAVGGAHRDEPGVLEPFPAPTLPGPPRA